MAVQPAADPPPYSEAEAFDALPIPPLDPSFFDQELMLPDHGHYGDSGFDNSFDQNDLAIDDLDFDFSFDDLGLPHDADDFINQNLFPDKLISDPADQIDSNCVSDSGIDTIGGFEDSSRVCKSVEPGLRHLAGSSLTDGNCMVMDYSSAELCHDSGTGSPNESRVFNSQSPDMQHVPGDRCSDVSGYLNVPSPESNGSNREISPESGNEDSGDCRILNCPSPESQSSGNCDSNLSEAGNCVSQELESNKSVSSALNCNGITARRAISAQRIKLEESNCNKESNSLLKRKKECEDSYNLDSRTNKCKKALVNDSSADSVSNTVMTEEDEKRKARLMRNRESAQLSRQRKKHYVEELEDKVRAMHSTTQELNARVSYLMAENATLRAENTTLRQQLGGGGGGPSPIGPPPPGMYPHPPVMYPWMPCAPPYMVKPQGSQVPLVPIPRLKPQQTSSAPKVNKKADNKKNEGKTKKAASVSFLGLLFFIFLFGGLGPMVNFRYGGMREGTSGGPEYVAHGYYEKHHGKVLMVNGTGYHENFDSGRNFNGSIPGGLKGHGGRQLNSEQASDEFARLGNGSEPLVASLYVPRNDKLEKIDGNLIIYSVLASDRAMATRKDQQLKKNDETGLAVPGDLARGIPSGRHPHLYRSPSEKQRALGAGSPEKGNLKSRVTDGRLQQWFREGLAGPMLSSGMCTEVFQFDVSAASGPGAIVPATTVRNVSEASNQNSTHANKGRNRRILNGLSVPLPGTSNNVSKEHASGNVQKDNLNRNSSASSMVVSVLVDPREAGEADVDGMIGPKSLSRIFVVVLVDSVKYVTYSCILPFKAAGPHLVTT